MHWQECPQLSLRHKQSIVGLWNLEYPAVLYWKGIQDFADYLAPLQDIHHFILIENNEVQGWYADFIRAEERWFLMIISSKLQGKGLGKQMMHTAQSAHNKLLGWVVDSDKFTKSNGSLYVTPLPFYVKMGFKILTDERLETKTLSAVKIKWDNAKCTQNQSSII